MMDELIREHIVGRATTTDLVKSAAEYQEGDRAALPAVMKNLRKIADFYPRHIAKEDKVFFPSAMKYLSESEQQAMLAEFREFDRKMIHDKYESVVDGLEK